MYKYGFVHFFKLNYYFAPQWPILKMFSQRAPHSNNKLTRKLFSVNGSKYGIRDHCGG